MTYSIIQKSQLEGAHRLDAEYYQPEYLRLSNFFKQTKAVALLKDVATITTGPAYSSEKIGVDLDIPVARIGDITNKIEPDEWMRLGRDEFERFRKGKIQNFDILMTMTGDPPDVGKCNIIVINGRQSLAFNQRVVKISSLGDPFYLFAYLSAEIARLQSERAALGIRQRNVGINDIKNIRIVLPRQDEKFEIGKMVKNYLIEKDNAKSLYSQAENLLLEELGLNNFKPKEDLAWVVNLSEVQKAKRIDAEFFQPKYDEIISKIKTRMSKLGDLVSIQKGIEVGSEQYQTEGKPFMRVSNLTKLGIAADGEKLINDELYQKSKNDYEPKIGEILLTKDASPGIAYVLKESVQGIIAGGILRLKIKAKIDAEYLALALNSIIGQMQMERDTGGSVIIHWRPEQVKNCLIPILSKPTQQKIAALVRKSHTARKKAKELLEQAKEKVEQVIEQGA